MLLTAMSSGVPAAHAQEPAARVKWEPYAIEVAQGQRVEAELGRIRVPENRKKPDDRSIDLAFVRLKSTSANPGPPLVFLEGGPGGSGINAARSPALSIFQALREIGDVILLDQRGTGITGPALTCGGAWNFPLDQPEGSPEQKRIATGKIRACAEQFRSKGIDISAYNPQESADDVDALRRALGVEKINLWGISYGTHLGLAVIRRHGDHVHRAVLTGVNGPNEEYMVLPSAVEAQISKVAALIRANAAMSQIVPDFPGTLRSLLAKLSAGPVVVELEDPQTKSPVRVTIGKGDLEFYTSSSITFTWGIMNLASLYGPLSKGDWTPLARRALDRRRDQIPSLMGAVTACSSGTSKQRRRQIERDSKTTQLGDAINSLLPEICAGLGNPDLGDGFRRPIRSNVPVLLVSGTADGRTPVSNAEAVLKGFPNGVHVIVEGASHGYDLFYFTPQVREAMLAFLKRQPVTTTRVKLDSFPFILPRPPGQGPPR